MAPLSLFLALDYPRVSEGHTEVLALQGNPRTLAFKQKGGGEKEVIICWLTTLLS